jgi:hypothetical protein
MAPKVGGLQVSVKTTDFDRLVNAIASVRTASILLIYRDYYQYLRPVLRARYDRISAETEYSQAWMGTTQKVSGRVRGEDALWGVDSGALYSDLTNNVKINQAGLEVFSDLPYAERILDLMATKGPYAPYHLWFVDDLDIEALEEIVEKRTRQFLGGAGA